MDNRAAIDHIGPAVRRRGLTHPCVLHVVDDDDAVAVVLEAQHLVAEVRVARHQHEGRPLLARRQHLMMTGTHRWGAGKGGIRRLRRLRGSVGPQDQGYKGGGGSSGQATEWMGESRPESELFLVLPYLHLVADARHQLPVGLLTLARAQHLGGQEACHGPVSDKGGEWRGNGCSGPWLAFGMNRWGDV
jgi:hypothetical protein